MERRTTWMGSVAMTRRELLAAGAVGAASSMVVTRPAGAVSLPVSLTRPAAAAPFPHHKVGKPVPAYDKIEHIIIVMMENHSYDNILGSCGRGDGLTFAGGDPTTRALNTNPNRPDDLNFATNPMIRAFEMPTPAQMVDKPSQAWGASWTQFYGTSNPTPEYLDPGPFPAERNSGFVISDSGPVAMGYYTEEHIPFIASMAARFPIADRWFGSCMAQTYPNRRFMMAGTALGQTWNDLSMMELPTNGTILQAMSEHNISWKNYFVSLPSTLIWPGQGKDVTFFDHLRNISNYFDDAKNGTLPSVSIVDPNFDRASGENAEDVQHHDAFLQKVVTAAVKGKNWDRTLLLFTYDEHGGYYDHVVPPTAPVPDHSAPQVVVKPGDIWGGGSSYVGFGRLGFRVPAIVVSPYAKTDYVSHTVFDHTAVMKLIEMKWNLPSFTKRDAKSNDPWEMVDLTHAPAFRNPNSAGLAGPTIEFDGTRPVSPAIGSYWPTREETVKYPDGGPKEPGKGVPRRKQYWEKKNGTPLPDKGETPFYAALRQAWEAT